jgi:hypothetical protein
MMLEEFYYWKLSSTTGNSSDIDKMSFQYLGTPLCQGTRVTAKLSSTAYAAVCPYPG